MDEVRAPDKDKIKAEYLKGVQPLELSQKYDISLNTLKSWIKRYGWTEMKKVKSAPLKKKGAPLKNKNAVGHKPSSPVKNKNAEKHGLFSKWLPEETQMIMGELAGISPLDILWSNIVLQTTAILRAQKIMYVEDKDEIIKEIIRSKTKSTSKETEKTTSSTEETDTEYAFQFAWDRQATFMGAQSRAQATLNSMMKQYDEMLHKNWDLATEEQKVRIAAIKKQIEDKDSGANEVIVKMEDKVKGWGE